MQLIGIGEAPAGDDVTPAGFVLSQLHELPKPGDHLVYGGWRFEVVDMDGRRIDMILVQRQPDKIAALESQSTTYHAQCTFPGPRRAASPARIRSRTNAFRCQP